MCNLSKGVEEKGIAKGIELGREEGIQAMASALKDLGIPDDTTILKLQEKFSLTKEEALGYVK